MKLSTCCGSAPVSYPGPHGTPDSDSEDHGICPECGDHCDYEEAKPDPNCKLCHGEGTIYDWVDYGMTRVQMPSECECVGRDME